MTTSSKLNFRSCQPKHILTNRTVNLFQYRAFPVRGFPYCICLHHKAVGWHPYCVRRHNKETNEEDRGEFYRNRSKKCENPSKSPLSAGFRLIFLSRKRKNTAEILAESITQRISPSFRRKALVNFSGDFRCSRTSRTGRTSPRFCWEISLSDWSDPSDSSELQ